MNVNFTAFRNLAHVEVPVIALQHTDPTLPRPGFFFGGRTNTYEIPDPMGPTERVLRAKALAEIYQPAPGAPTRSAAEIYHEIQIAKVNAHLQARAADAAAWRAANGG